MNSIAGFVQHKPADSVLKSWVVAAIKTTPDLLPWKTRLWMHATNVKQYILGSQRAVPCQVGHAQANKCHKRSHSHKHKNDKHAWTMWNASHKACLQGSKSKPDRNRARICRQRRAECLDSFQGRSDLSPLGVFVNQKSTERPSVGQRPLF